MNTNTRPPDAIILACWPSEDLAMNQLRIDPSSVPLADKCMLQRVLEKLVGLGCREILVVLGDRPQICRKLLGTGERWGCHVNYCFALLGDRPLSVLTRYFKGEQGHCLIAVADTVIASSPETSGHSAVCWVDSGFVSWTGWANLSYAKIRRIALTVDGRQSLETDILNDTGLVRQRESQPLSTADARLLINSLPRLFRAEAGPSGISHRQNKPHIWIGNGSNVDPGAHLIAPVYIGNYVRIAAGVTVGPDVIVGDGCLIDQDSVIQFSLVVPDTYVGAKLEINGAIVSAFGLVNIRLDAIAPATDPAFISGLTVQAVRLQRVPFWQRLVALILWMSLWPVVGILRVIYRNKRQRADGRIGVLSALKFDFVTIATNMKCSHDLIYGHDQDVWLTHFLTTFHPGLADVVIGRVMLVGLEARTAQQIAQLPDYWRELYRSARIGLINEGLLMEADDAGAVEMRYACDVLAAAAQRPVRVLGILFQYAKRVVCNSCISRHPQSVHHRRTRSIPGEAEVNTKIDTI
jgi:hypothetical protein